jgi:phage gpG-like protein
MQPEQVGNYLKEQIGEKVKRALTILEVAAVKSIKKNFEAGGRPPWPAWAPSTARRKKGNARLLVVSGNLSNVVTVRNEAERSITLSSNPLARAYARIHQEGGIIHHPARTLRFRRTKTGRTVFASSRHKRIVKQTTSKPYVVKIPARPYMVIPQEDLNAIAQKIQQEI